MRILFAGTPDTAIPSLHRLIADGHEVAAVLTRAPARAGRRHKVVPSAVHQAAEELGLPVLTPTTLRDEEIQKHIKELAPDAVAVVAYGLLVPPALLDIPAHGWINLHFSVLPAWRETDYFSPKERAALERVEAVTLVADGQVPDAVYAQAAGVLSKEEIAAVEWLAVVINAWNRIAISSRYPVRA